MEKAISRVRPFPVVIIADAGVGFMTIQWLDPSRCHWQSMFDKHGG